MKIDSESFKGKLWLLIIDKVFIGALIAAAFFLYNVHRASETREYEKNRIAETRKYEEKRAQVQLDFERARLLKEFMPLITDRKLKVVDRGYMLRTALATKSLDSEAGVEIGREMIDEGISEHHFRRIMALALPDGLPAIVRHADRLLISLGRGELFRIFSRMLLNQPSQKYYKITEQSLHKLKS